MEHHQHRLRRVCFAPSKLDEAGKVQVLVPLRCPVVVAEGFESQDWLARSARSSLSRGFVGTRQGLKTDQPASVTMIEVESSKKLFPYANCCPFSILSSFSAAVYQDYPVQWRVVLISLPGSEIGNVSRRKSQKTYSPSFSPGTIVHGALS